MNDRTGWIDSGVEGIRTGGCSQNTPDCIETVGGLISDGFGEG